MGSKIDNPVVTKKSKNQLRRERAKLLKQQEKSNGKKVVEVKKTKEDNNNNDDDDIVVVEETPVDEQFAELYKDVLEKFEPKEEEIDVEEEEKKENENVEQKQLVHRDNKGENDKINDSDEEENKDKDSKESNPQSLSKRQFKKKYGIPLYVLKSETIHPELVEWIDADAEDPRLHIYLKTLPDSVPVPQHWRSKKSFLSMKRGVERPPFELPKFISDTGISEMRPTVDPVDSGESTTLKQRTRERIQPKVGQLDLDYDRLYDAFFKYQKKPHLLKFGECYTESMNNKNNQTAQNAQPTIQRKRYWGEVVNDLDKDSNTTTNSNTRDDIDTNTAYEPSKGDVLVNKIGHSSTPSQSQYNPTPRQSNTPQHLYRVLHTQQNTNDQSIFGSKTTSYRYNNNYNNR